MFLDRRCLALLLLIAGALGIGAGGASAAGWLVPEPLPLAMSDVGFDASGTAIAVGIGADAGGDPMVRAMTRSPGGPWSASAPVSATGDSNPWAPRVAVGPQGDAVAIWAAVDDALSRRIVWVASRTPDGAWGTPVALSTGTVVFRDEQVALDGDGDATAIWNEWDGSTYVLRSATRPHGGRWSAPEDISARGDGTVSDASLAVNASGDAIAVWILSDGQIVQAARRTTGGAWGAPIALSSSGLPTPPQVVIDPQGDATAVWGSTESGVSVVRTAQSAAGSGWGATTVLASGDSPRLAVDPTGSVTAVWVASTPDGPNVRSSSHADAGPWSTSVELAVSSGLGRVGTPWVAVDPRGREIAIWARTNGGDVTAQASHRVAEGGWSTAVDLSVSSINALPAAAVDAAGHVILLWTTSGSSFGGPWAGFSSVFDDVAPELRNVVVPARGTVGQSVSLSVDPFDVWSSVTTSWDFGDGGSASGAALSHTYSSPGERTVTVTGVDSAGNTTQTARTITIDPAPGPPGGPGGPGGSGSRSGSESGTDLIVAPVVSRLTQSHSRWRTQASRGRFPVGTIFRLRLNRAASVRLSFSQIVSGRRVSGRCVKPAKANRRKPRCERYRSGGAVSLKSKAGSNAYVFRGQVSGRMLKPGRYRLTVTALAEGKTSRAVSIRFTIAG